MNEVRALICCNNPIAVPGIREFLFYGKVAAIVVPRRNKEMQHILRPLLEEAEVPLVLLDKKEYAPQLREAILQHRPTVGFLMTFPYILGEEILSMPDKGFINFHYGLLPQCRGPQPVLWHLLNNDAHSGVTLHKVDGGIDTGPIVMQEKVPIESTDTYGLLQSKLAYLAAKLASDLLKILSYGSIIPAVPQDESLAHYYEMPDARQLSIDWEKMTAASIIRLANACNPWNKGAGTTYQGWPFGITEAEDAGPCDDHAALPGTILSVSAEDGLLIKTADNRKLRVTIFYTAEGFFSGHRLAQFHIQAGAVLAS